MALVVVDDFVCGVKLAPDGGVSLVFEEIIFRDDDMGINLRGNKNVFVLAPKSWEALKKQADEILTAAKLEIREHKLEVVGDTREADDGPKSTTR